jgi:serine/threonine protein kinase/Tol biopolymer transport system component
VPLEAGSLLHDRYRILEELGRGGMGAVYRAQDTSLGVDVAIKENFFTTPESERQFKREASLLATLRHPHLPRVTDHFVIPDQGQYLVMDFVPGRDCRQILEAHNGPLPQDEVLRWMREILDALIYLHSRPQPIIHRDIKPGNIKITPDDKAVLVDFGLAKIHDASRSTTTGAKAFTPGFAPPEQYGLGRTDGRTDIFSLGATMYMLLSGKLPEDSLERAMGHVELTPIGELNASVSPQVAAAIEKAMAPRPENRYQTADEFLKALRAPSATTRVALEPTRVHAPTLPPTIRSSVDEVLVKPPPTRRSFLVPALAGGGVLLVLGVIGIVVVTGLLRSGSGLVASAPSTTPTQTSAPAPAATPTTAAPPAVVDTPAALPEDTATPEVPPTPASTPRGSGHGQIAFVSQRAGRPQVFLMNVDGSELTQLTDLADGACQPSWSPDGERLLFITPCLNKSDVYERSALYVMNADGSDQKLLLSMVGGLFDPAWSTSGIVFTFVENNRLRLWWVGQDGNGAKQLSQPNSADRQASWSPEGDRLAFMNTSRAGSPTIYWMFQDGTFNGSNPDQITRDRAASSPAWSPLGDLIAYVADVNIFIVRWDAHGFDAQQLTSEAPNADPDWSPDGQWIVFESWRDAANHDIYIMSTNGASVTRLTEDPGLDYQPAWRP